LQAVPASHHCHVSQASPSAQHASIHADLDAALGRLARRGQCVFPRSLVKDCGPHAGSDFAGQVEGDQARQLRGARRSGKKRIQLKPWCERPPMNDTTSKHKGEQKAQHNIYIIYIYTHPAQARKTSVHNNNNNNNELPANTGPPTDRAVQQPEAQGPVSTVSCMGRGAAGTHASWQMGAR
jgi:hypothetical protein